MFEKFRPLGDRVLIKLLESEEKTASGIFLPETAKEKPQRACVVAVGPGRTLDGKTIPLAVKVNDIVFFGKYAGTEADKDHLIIREDDILGILEQ